MVPVVSGAAVAYCTLILANIAVPGTWIPAAAWCVAWAGREGPEAKLLGTEACTPVASSWRGFCKSHKMALAAILCSQKCWAGLWQQQQLHQESPDHPPLSALTDGQALAHSHTPTHLPTHILIHMCSHKHSTRFSSWLPCSLAARLVWGWEQEDEAPSYSAAILGPVKMYILHFIYPCILWWTLGLLLSFVHCE